MGWQENLLGYGMALTAGSLLLFIVGIVAMRYAMIYLPADYFVREQRVDGWWFDQHPAVRWLLVIMKNLLGVACLLLGTVMLFVWGPGILMLLLGLALVNLPGKRRLELWLISFPKVLSKINALRIRHGKSPLQMPPARH